MRSLLDAKYYTSPEIFAREQERIFRRLWIFAGVATLLAEPDSYITRTIGGVPVVIQDFPITRHVWAFPAAILARWFAAQSPSLGVEFRSFIFEHQRDIRPDNLRQYGEHPLAPDAQYKLAQCYEEMGDFDLALEAYVTLAATYPKSPLVASVMIRVGDHFYKKEQFDVAAQIGEKFVEKFEGHQHASRMAFRVGQCRYKAGRFTEAGEPSVSMRPFSRRKKQSARTWASARLWVMCNVVTPVLARMLASKSHIWRRVSSSRALSGSSRHKIRGRKDSARPNATRWRSPPLSPRGLRCSRGEMPNRSANSRTRCRIAGAGTWRMTSDSPNWSSTVIFENKAPSCGT